MIRWLASAASGSSELRDDAAHRRDVRVQVAVELGVGELGERLHLEALVAVGHENRQQAADVRPVDRELPGDRPRGPVGRELAAPSADGVHPVQLVRVAVLTEQVDLMTLRASAWARLAL